MPTFQLSTGCCARLPLTSYDDDPHWKEPVVQFLSIQKVLKGNTERYRLIISDGIHFIQAILATPCNPLVETENIQNFTVAIIEKWTSNTVQGKRLVILLSVRILGNPNQKIGEPVSLNDVVDGITRENLSVATIPNVLPATDARRLLAEESRRSPLTNSIEDLNPYQNIWTIKARVIQKGDIKTWSNDTSDGKLFGITLMDESGEIRATAFNIAADELFAQLEEGKVYYISGGRIKLANKKFCKGDYEIFLETNTQIQECHDPNLYPQIKLRFVPIGELGKLEKDTLCDVIGVLREVGGVADIVTRQDSRLVKKQDLTLVDDTRCSVKVTMWGNLAEAFHAVQGSIVTFTNVRVGDFGGVSLSTTSSSRFEVDPQIEARERLRLWYDTEGTNLTFQQMTMFGGGGGIFSRAEALNLNRIKESGFGTGGKPEFFSTQGTIIHIRGENIYYPACTGSNCFKKMTQDEDSWHCAKCGARDLAPNYRYIMNMVTADWSDAIVLTGFDEAGIVIFGRSAAELHDIRMRDEAEYADIIREAMCCRFSLSCRARKETFNNQESVRYHITRIEAIDHHEEASLMLELLRGPPWR